MKRGFPQLDCDDAVAGVRLRREQIKLRKIPTVGFRVPAEQPQAHDRGMGADEEIGQDTASRASGRAVALEYLPRERKRRPRHRHKGDVCLGKKGLDALYDHETHGKLGIGRSCQRYP